MMRAKVGGIAAQLAEAQLEKELEWEIPLYKKKIEDNLNRPKSMGRLTYEEYVWLTEPIPHDKALL